MKIKNQQALTTFFSLGIFFCTILFFFITPALIFSLGDREPVPPSQPSETEPTDPEKDAPEIDSNDAAWKQERLSLVKKHIAGAGIQDPLVLEAMGNTPRHLFVPENQRSGAYLDRPLRIGFGQTISQPYIVAYMTELLGLQGDEKILEIGTGSGYQAAVLAEITPHVYTIEIIKELAGIGEANLRKAGYNNVKVKQGDGYFGWKEQAPFDGIIVTAAAGHVPPPLIEQLKPGGVIVIPVGGVYQVQTLMRLTKDEEGEVSSEHLLPVRFVPMTGAAQE